MTASQLATRPPRRWPDLPYRTTAELVARGIWNGMTAQEQDSVSIQALFRKFCNLVPCSVCRDFGMCGHRDRRRALEMVIPPDSPLTATPRRVREYVKQRVWGAPQL